ncbi:MAG: hypothetical protein ACXW27_15825 [Allosphingosinicella sp.]
MRYLALLALWALPAGAAAPCSNLPLQALTEADVGADALENAACYAHDGPAVLVLATNRNAVVSWNGDLLLLDRVDDGKPPHEGAKYAGSRFRILISPAQGDVVSSAGRTDRPAHIRVVRKGAEDRLAARWSCGPRKSA